MSTEFCRLEVETVENALRCRSHSGALCRICPVFLLVNSLCCLLTSRQPKACQNAIDDYSPAIEMNRFRAGHAYKGRAECYKAFGNPAATERELKQSKGGEAVYR